MATAVIPIPSFLLPPVWVWIAVFFAALATMVWIAWRDSTPR
jgi:hypothetical protein